MSSRFTRRLGRLTARRRRGTLALLVAAAALTVLAGWTILQHAGTGESGPAVGVIPDEIPDDFPLPPEAAVGESTVEGATVTVELTTSGTLADAVSRYTVGLVSAGFVVEESSAAGEGWRIAFSRGDLRGTIDLAVVAIGVESLVTIRQ